jgi:predicted Zn-dependent peptidase
MHSVHKVTLSNGLRVVVVSRPHLFSSRAVLFIRGGSRIETPETSGASHFLEHLLFRGTPKFRNSHELDLWVEEMGGDTNGFTDRCSTGLEIDVPSENLGPALDVLADLVREPKFLDMEIERDVVLSEISEDLGPEGGVLCQEDLLCQSAYAGSALSSPVLGTLESVLSLTKDTLKVFHQRFYGARNMVLVIATPKSPEEVQNHLGPFRDLPQGEEVQFPPVVYPENPSRVTFAEGYGDLVTLVAGFRVPGPKDPECVSLDLVSRILGDGSTSRVTKRLRTELGLAYSAEVYHTKYEDQGLFWIGLSVNPQKTEEALRELLQLFQQLRKVPTSEAELSKAKTRARYQIGMSEDSLGFLAEFYGNQEVLGEELGLGHYLEGLLGVTSEGIQTIAEKHFTRGNLFASVVGFKGDRSRLLGPLSGY